MRQETKMVTQENSVVIEVEEPARGKTLLTTRKIAIPTRHYAKFEIECNELEGRFEIKPEPFLHKNSQTCGWAACNIQCITRQR